ncbi:hypothetical protein MMC22_007493 [Lobaria immixta]|nr:hypothetical protein [Lobaria immixta]
MPAAAAVATGPSSRGWQEIRVGIALTAMATIAVILRFIARYRRKLNLEIDDWFTLAALILIFAMFIEIVLWATIGNNGKHIYTLTPHDVQTFVKIFLTNELTYSITSPTVKLSIVLFYRRLFPTRKFRIITNGIMVAVIAWGLAVFLAAALQCRPLHALWDPSVNGHCFDTLKYILGVQGVNIALDFAILILPMPQVWTLQRPWQDKFAVSIVFLLGGL